MRRLIAKFVLLIGSVLLLLAAGAFWPLRHRYAQSTTTSNLLMMPADASKDVVLLGTSHARVLSMKGNHERLERSLGRSVLNLAKLGKGPYVERMFLEYFYARGNSADTIVYLIDPWVMYDERYNENADALADEPLDPRFAAFLARFGAKPSIWINYLRTKATPEWWLTKPDRATEETRQASLPDAATVERHLAGWYAPERSPEAFRRYAGELRRIAELAQAHDARVIFAIPPTLLGDLPGKDAVITELEAIQKDLGMRYADHSNAMRDPGFYFDNDHLNTAGAEAYAETFLKPLLQ